MDLFIETKTIGAYGKMLAAEEWPLDHGEKRNAGGTFF